MEPALWARIQGRCSNALAAFMLHNCGAAVLLSISCIADAEFMIMLSTCTSSHTWSNSCWCPSLQIWQGADVMICVEDPLAVRCSMQVTQSTHHVCLAMMQLPYCECLHCTATKCCSSSGSSTCTITSGRPSWHRCWVRGKSSKTRPADIMHVSVARPKFCSILCHALTPCRRGKAV